MSVDQQADPILQRLGVPILSTLHMLIRNVRMYAPDNAIFLKPIETLIDAINRVVAGTGSFSLQAAKSTMLINGAGIKLDFAGLKMLEQLTAELEKRDIGGFTTEHPINSHQICAFLGLFSGAPVSREETGLKVSSHRAVVEVLNQTDRIDRIEKIDRQKYLMTVYARGVRLVSQMRSMGEGEPLPLSSLVRIVRDLVDLSREQRDGFFTMTGMTSATQPDAYHVVNTALLSIVLGGELGLTRSQLLDLGASAILAGLEGDVPKRLLMSSGASRASVRCILAVRDSKLGGASAGPFGRIIAVAECYGRTGELTRPDLDPGLVELLLAITADERSCAVPEGAPWGRVSP
jgi:hypothetical protein